MRIASWTVLAVVGSVAAVAFVYGDRTARGLAFAALLTGAVLACVIAWRENRTAERRRRATALHDALLHAEQLSAERVRQRAVLSALGTRVATLRGQLDAANARSVALQQQLSTLRGDHRALKVELELAATLAAADVVALTPREPADPWVTARELWRIDDPVPAQQSA